MWIIDYAKQDEDDNDRWHVHLDEQEDSEQCTRALKWTKWYWTMYMCTRMDAKISDDHDNKLSTRYKRIGTNSDNTSASEWVCNKNKRRTHPHYRSQSWCIQDVPTCTTQILEAIIMYAHVHAFKMYWLENFRMFI